MGGIEWESNRRDRVPEGKRGQEIDAMPPLGEVTLLPGEK